MFKVVIDKAEGNRVNFMGEGDTIEEALQKAKELMEEDYGRGVTGFNYNTYKFDADCDKWEYLQTLGV